MKITLGFMALGAMVTIALGNGVTAKAQSAQTDTRTAATAAKTVIVKSGDTLDAIAKARDTTYVRLFNANASIAHPDRIDVGDKVTIPAKDEVLPDRFSMLTPVVVPVAVPAPKPTPAAVVAPAPTQAAVPAAARCNEATQWVRADNGQCLDKPVARPVAVQPVRHAAAAPAPAPAAAQAFGAPAGNFGSYNMGNGWWCTDYVKSKRPDVPTYGNAGMYWIGAAHADGKATGTVPRAGAVAVMPGHVAYVESVNANGSYVVSEMGWMFQAGQFNRRTVQPGAFGGFIY